MNTTKKLFQVGSQQVRARADAGLNGAFRKWIPAGTLLEVDARSRRELDGWVWWKHAEGWSAERTVDGLIVYLLEVAAAPAPAAPAEFSPIGTHPAAPARSAPAPVMPTPPAPTPTPARRTFQIGSIQVRVRAEPGLSGAFRHWIQPGTQIQVLASSRREVDGWVWWQHDEGWTAECTVDRQTVYLVEPGTPVPAAAPVSVPASSVLDVNALPMRESLFKRLPVDLSETHWWQYFGNNVFAYNLWRDGTRWYAYAQGLHGGLDFGNSTRRGVPVYAGVEGTYVLRDTQYTKPNGLWVQVGDYTIIYGHLANPRFFNRGNPIGVDTVLGELEFGGQNHLHLEVRYKDRYIVNPLLFMSEAMRTPIINKFRPDTTYFYSDPTWTRWQSPFDQPVLILGGPLIGPHAPR